MSLVLCALASNFLFLCPTFVAADTLTGFADLIADPGLVITPVPMTRPAYLDTVLDPSFGTRVTRITGPSGSGVNGLAGRYWGDVARHRLYCDQPWSSDGSLLAVRNAPGSLVFLDGATYQPVSQRPVAWTGDDRWHPSAAHPRTRVMAMGRELFWYDAITGEKTRTWRLPFTADRIGSGEGNLSEDGRFVALNDASQVVLVDMDPPPGSEPRIGPAAIANDCGDSTCKIVGSSVSPSGRYVVLNYAGTIPPRVFDVDPATLALTPRVYPATNLLCGGANPASGFIYDVDQADLARNPFDGGEDVIVGREHCGNRGKIIDGKRIGGVVAVRLRDGVMFPLTDGVNEAFVQSVSARNDQRPGWVYVSYYPQDGRRFGDEIVALELDGSGDVQRFAHKRSLYKACTECSPHPVPSRDGRRVLWASNWSIACDSCGPATQVAGYIVDGSAEPPPPPPNQSPTGVIVEPPADDFVIEGTRVRLLASGTDPDGDSLSYHWSFDGALPELDGQEAFVVFEVFGTYRITLTVTDSRGLADPNPVVRLLTVVKDQVEPPQEAHEVHWTLSGATSVTFDWRLGDDYVRYGSTSAYGSRVTAIAPSITPRSSAGPFREARIDGLQPDTEYHYAIGQGPDHVFRTPPLRGASGFDVFVAGDIGSTLSYKRSVAPLQQIIAADLPRFSLMVGDLTYGNSHGQPDVEQHFDDVMPWSQDAAYMPAWGNHEWDEPTNDDLRNYKGRFDLPNPQTSPGSPSVSCCGEDWYWFDYGNTRFIAYPEPWSGAWLDWSRKADALMQQAQNDTAIAFVVTFGHRPAYSSGHHPGATSLKGYLDALGARYDKYALNLCGHAHNYERTHPQFGVVHITAGGGGSNIEYDPKNGCVWRGGCPPPSWSAFRAMHYSVVKLRFDRDQIEGWTVCGPSSDRDDIACTQGAPLDHFVIPRRGGAPPPPPPAAENLVGNPSFETALTGWNGYGGARVERVPGGVEDEFCAQVAADSARDVFGINDAPNWISKTLAVGERYRITAWVRAVQDSSRARLRVREYLGTALQASVFSEGHIANAEWKELTLDYTARALGSTLDLNVLFDTSHGHQLLQADQISIERVSPTPATPAMAAEWAEEDEEDGHGAAILGARIANGRFEASIRPSPVRDRSTLSLTLTRRGPVEIKVYDINGRTVKTLVDAADFGVGRHEISLDAHDDRGGRLAPGVYLYRVRAAEGTLTGRAVIVP